MTGSILVRNGIIALDSRPIPYSTAQRKIVDTRNGKQCCCGGVGCTSCCFPSFNGRPLSDGTQFCCLAKTTPPARVTHAYMLASELRGTILRTYEAIATNLPQDIAAGTSWPANCGIYLEWDWTDDLYDNGILTDHFEGSDATVGVAWFPGPMRVNIGGQFRYIWEPVTATGRGSGFIPLSNGEFIYSGAWYADSRGTREDCDFVNKSWTLNIGGSLYSITIQALVERLGVFCAPRTGGTPCAACP